MSYPERPVCHGEMSPNFKLRPIEWEARKAKGPYGVNMRHCNYCGSLHPEDLLTALESGASLEGADWKYGWPHKFYVNGIPNPMTGEIVEMGGTHEGDKYTPHMAPAPKTLTKKFYNEHLIDLTGTPEFDVVAEAIRKRTGIRFSMRDEKLYYQTCQWDEIKKEVSQ